MPAFTGIPFLVLAGPHPRSLSLGDFAPRSGRRRFFCLLEESLPFRPAGPSWQSVGSAVSTMQSEPEATSRDGGFTLIELLVVIGVIGVVSAIAIPALLRAKITANETAVIGSIRAISSAEVAYAAAAATGGYATDFAVLSQSCPGSNQGFISPDLAGDPAQKSGYIVNIGTGSFGAGPTDCNGRATTVGYYLTAVPITIGLSGQRGFASSTPGVIFFDANGVAPTEAQMAPGGGGAVIQ
jgi:type IV pilus assembly protein PilA